ncbi:hypothetical protein CLF_109082 [Clonorchis sinensis]|uniref:Uncharacterized protein n=1 Tax=Clonorchis sinensis TaxID=79923 RepID=G7YIY1_CLOSI|nr:hypothetical protein CLF_109082 [Clonorchis sinensis]
MDRETSPYGSSGIYRSESPLWTASRNPEETCVWQLNNSTQSRSFCCCFLQLKPVKGKRFV